MIHEFKGLFPFTRKTLDDWDSNIIGVYYLGEKNIEGKLTIYYIGKSTAEDGIRGRLYDHLSRWHDVTHFGYERCDSAVETDKHESSEIKAYNPKYNKTDS
jgi:hypothetical protein